MDIGGTKIAVATIDVSVGKVLKSVQVPTPPAGSREEVLQTIRSAVSALGLVEKLPIGIGVCEYVDNAGRILSSYAVDLKDANLPAEFADLGDVVVGSDVRAGAMAEFRFGAARGTASTFYVSAGTGISSCLLLNGVPIIGAHGVAIVLGAPPVEIQSSGRALDKKRQESDLTEPQLHELVTLAGRRTGEVVATIVNAIDPELIVIGGGLGLSETFFNSLAETVLLLAHKDTPSPYRVVPAELGTDAGVIGAALLTY